MTEPDVPATPGASEPMTVFVVSWGRPLYLWACLDALHRLTRSAARIVLLDNAHPDPLVGEVIRGFVRRGLFAEVLRFPTNAFANIRHAYQERLAGAGQWHVYLESDCVIDAGPGCWLATMRGIMETHPRIGMLGSLIRPEDFVAEQTALDLVGGDRTAAEFLAKLRSPERDFAGDPTWSDTSRAFFLTEPPFPLRTPPGRLMMLRTDVMQGVGFDLDLRLAARVREAGYQTAVTPLVRHRHLSLLNVFDYADYDARQRHDFFAAPGGGAG